MRIFGYIVGFLLLANGILTMALPHQWTNLTVHKTEEVVPQAGFLEDFTSLSSPTIRYGGIAETVVGAVVIALASRIPGMGRRSVS